MRLHKPVPPHQQPHLQGFFQGGIPTDEDADQGYDDGGEVNPNAYLQWPNQPPIPQQGFAEGGDIMSGDDNSGQVNWATSPDPGQTDLSALANHATQVYDQYHKDMEAAWNQANGGGAQVGGGGSDNDADDQGYAQGGGIPDPDEGDPRMQNVRHENVDNIAPYNSFSQSAAELSKHDSLPEVPVGADGQPMTPEGKALKAKSFSDAPQTDSSGLRNTDMAPADLATPEHNEAFAQGGGIPPPGPAGAGVRPKPAKSHKAAVDRNYYQDVSSRPATSPARGTAFSPAGPDGGQRGQEWYGKGASPYGAGRKKKANG